MIQGMRIPYNATWTGFMAGLCLLCCQIANAGDEVIFKDRFEPAPVVTNFDVVWSADTRLIEGDNVDALLDISSDNEVFTFSTALLAAANLELEAGDILVIEGIALRRIVSVEIVGETTKITTSQAALNEAIESGDMDWTVQIGFNELATAQALIPERGVQCNPDFDVSIPSVTFKCAFSDYTITMKLVGGADTTTVQFQLLKGGDTATASFTGTGVLSNFQSDGNASFAGGELESFGHETTDTQMDIKLALAAAAAGSHDPFSYEVPFPVLRLPFTVGPIPMSIDIGVRVAGIMNVPASVQASALAEADFRLSSDTGLTYQGSNTDFEAKINDYEFSNGSFDSAAPIGVQVNAGFGLAFPRVSLNVLASEVAYVHTGLILESHLYWGPVCKEALARIVVQGGYKLEILGVEILADQTTFAEQERREPPGGC